MLKNIFEKKAILALSLVFISIIVIEIKDNYSFSKNHSLAVNATKITNKVIVIDAGHGMPDEGASLLHKENKQLTF